MSRASVGPRRLVHIVESLELGGMERAIATLCKATDPERFAVAVLATKRLGPVADELAELGVPVHCLHASKGRVDYLGWRQVVGPLRALRPDVVHTHNGNALLFGAPVARWLGVRSIVHTDHGQVLPGRRHLMLAERIAATCLRRYVAVSQPLANEVVQHLHMPRAKTVVIENGVASVPALDAVMVTRFRSALLRPGERVLVGLAARLVWEKGLDVLLEAWAARVRGGQSGVRLVVAGDGPERDALERQARQLGVDDTVSFLGMQRDVSTLYRSLDAFVLPSVSEGLPLALLEAMSASLPIVATSVGGIPEALGGGQAGLLVPPGNAPALADALGRLLAQGGASELAAELGKAARRQFEVRYTAAAMAARYAQLYDGNPDPALEQL